jgi:hypothetical protein
MKLGWKGAWLRKAHGRPQKECRMAKGMNKQGKNTKKPKKEVAKPAVAIASSKNSVNLSGNKTRD